MSDEPSIHANPVTADPAAVKIRRWSRFNKIAAIFVAGWVSIILEKIIKLDSLLGGVEMGGVGGVFLSPFLLIITLPLAWLGSKIGEWKKWRKHRLLFTFGLPSLYLLMGPATALYERSFPQPRFESFTGVAFPREARVKQCIIDDGFGPLYDKGFTYEFTCSAEETERLIHELKLTKLRDGKGSFWSTGSGKVSTRGGWVIDEIWSMGSGRVRHADFIELAVDATRTKVRITPGNI